MNAGFANLATLKQQLVASSMQSDDTFDTVLARLGLGVAAAFDNFCQRKFQRATGVTEIFAADYAHFQLSRFPLEQITAIAVKFTEADGWETQTINQFVRTIDLDKGMIYLPGADAGPFDAQVRFTYDGGYFWNTLEPADNGYPTALPTGATPLPADLQTAWLLQCEQIWKVRDKLGVNIVEGDQDKFVTSSLAELKLSPFIKDLLADYVKVTMV